MMDTHYCGYFSGLTDVRQSKGQSNMVFFPSTNCYLKNDMLMLSRVKSLCAAGCVAKRPRTYGLQSGASISLWLCDAQCRPGRQRIHAELVLHVYFGETRMPKCFIPDTPPASPRQIISQTEQSKAAKRSGLAFQEFWYCIHCT